MLNRRSVLGIFTGSVCTGTFTIAGTIVDEQFVVMVPCAFLAPKPQIIVNTPALTRHSCGRKS